MYVHRTFIVQYLLNSLPEIKPCHRFVFNTKPPWSKEKKRFVFNTKKVGSKIRSVRRRRQAGVRTAPQNQKQVTCLRPSARVFACPVYKTMRCVCFFLDRGGGFWPVQKIKEQLENVFFTPEAEAFGQLLKKN